MFFKWLRNYFGFSRLETKAMTVLIPCFLFVLVGHILFSKNLLKTKVDYSADRKSLDSLYRVIISGIGENTQISGVYPLSSFNPDTVSRNWLTDRGIPGNIASALVNYQKAGGKIRSPGDLKKIYGINDSLYQIISPHLLIDHLRTENKKSTTQIMGDLNLADSLSLREIYGIGKVLSSRIVKYRELLGGFVHWEQLYEVYGLDSSVVDRMMEKYRISKEFMPRVIDLDSVTLEKLIKHPYLSYQEAKLITAYKSQHGSIKKEDLLLIPGITREKFRKLSPYLK